MAASESERQVLHGQPQEVRVASPLGVGHQPRVLDPLGQGSQKGLLRLGDGAIPDTDEGREVVRLNPVVFRGHPATHVVEQYVGEVVGRRNLPAGCLYAVGAGHVA